MPQARECPSVTIVSSRRPRRLRSLFRSSQPWTMPANSPWPREPEHIRLEPSAEPFFSLLSLLSSEDSVDRKSTRLNSSHLVISYAVFCLKKKKNQSIDLPCVISLLETQLLIT